MFRSFSKRTISSFFSRCRSRVHSRVCDHGSSSIIGRLMERASSVPVHIRVLSGCSYVGSGQFRSRNNCECRRSCFKSVISDLGLGPTEMGGVLARRNCETCKHFPGHGGQGNGRRISCRRFCRRLVGSYYKTGLLACVNEMDLGRLCRTSFSLGRIVVPGNGYYKLFDSACNNKDLLRVRLGQSMGLGLRIGSCRNFHFQLSSRHSGCSYSIQRMCKISSSFFKSTIHVMS